MTSNPRPGPSPSTFASYDEASVDELPFIERKTLDANRDTFLNQLHPSRSEGCGNRSSAIPGTGNHG
jgi:hypothetical protein